MLLISSIVLQSPLFRLQGLHKRQPPDSLTQRQESEEVTYSPC